jgi:CheY-like chemotaxis protein
VTSHLLRSTGADVTLEFTPALPNVFGSPDQLRQVVVNLITNARNALEGVEGRRVITIKTIHDAAQKLVTVKVTDNGPGVPEQHRSRIFEPLFTTRAPGKGTGVGLALCRRIMASHHGAIQLASTSARGTTFAASLPQIDEAPTLTLRGAFSTKEDPDKLDILIVEDDPETSRRLAEIVAGDGHGVEVAETEFVALERLTRRSYAVIFCRLGMDGADGRNFFGSLSETMPDMAQRVVFVTNANIGHEVVGYLDLTERPYITSPIRRSAVHEVVELLSMRATN